MLIYYYWPESAGGAENQCRKLVRVLAQNGKDIVILTSRQRAEIPREEYDCGGKIVRITTFETWIRNVFRRNQGSNIPSSNKKDQPLQPTKNNPPKILPDNIRNYLSKIASRVIRYLNVFTFVVGGSLYLYKHRENFDLIHVHTADWIAGMAAIEGKINNVPVICKGANIPVFPMLVDVPFSYFIDKWRRKPFFIALTTAMAEDLINNDVPTEKITTIPNGVEIPSLVASPGSDGSFLFLGNFSQTEAHKGFDILLNAWLLVVQQAPDAHLVLAGGGDSSKWQKTATEYGIDSNVSFPGYCADVEKLFLKSCCLVLPSRKEGISNALLEAQSYGIPAVVSDIPGNREVVQDGKTGMIVPVGNVSALAEAILKFHRSPDFRRSCGAAARSRIEKYFSINSVACRTEKLYAGMIDDA